MHFETPFVEYLISGTHTSIWLLMVVMAILGLPLQSLLGLNVGLVVLFIPLAYTLGALISTLTALILNPFRVRIRNSLFPYEHYKDEMIAYSSSDLYAAYTARMHRVRLMGASIFNWLFLAVALLFHGDFTKSPYYVSVIIIPLLLSVLSAIAWYSLIKRLLEFRKNAIDIIREESKKRAHSKIPKKNS